MVSGPWMESETIYSAVTVVFIILCVYVPLISYHGKKYHLQRKHIVYVKRYANIVLYEVYLSLIKSLLVCIAFMIPLMSAWHARRQIEIIGIISVTINFALSFGLLIVGYGDFGCYIITFNGQN